MRGRPAKKGLEFFSFETDWLNDPKLQSITREWGFLGVGVINVLLSMIYKEGYYLTIDEDFFENFAELYSGRRAEIDKDQVKLIIQYCCRKKFFDQACFEKFNILTSSGIQKRYFNACTKRSEIVIIEDFLLTKDIPEINITYVDHQGNFRRKKSISAEKNNGKSEKFTENSGNSRKIAENGGNSFINENNSINDGNKSEKSTKPVDNSHSTVQYSREDSREDSTVNYSIKNLVNKSRSSVVDKAAHPLIFSDLDLENSITLIEDTITNNERLKSLIPANSIKRFSQFYYNLRVNPRTSKPWTTAKGQAITNWINDLIYIAEQEKDFGRFEGGSNGKSYIDSIRAIQFE